MSLRRASGSQQPSGLPAIGAGGPAHAAPYKKRHSGLSEREAKALLGEDFPGIACSDRWWAYDYLDPERRQLCWAHYADLRVMPTSSREALSGAVIAALRSA